MKRRIWTRKRKALSLTAVTLVLFFLFQYTYGICLMHPVQARWEAEQFYGCGSTERICHVWDGAVGQHVTLSSNEHALLLIGTYSTLSGWSCRDRDAVDCSEAAPLYGGTLRLSDGAVEDVVYAYGQVNDAAIDKIQLSFCFAANETAPTETHIYLTDAEDWHEHNGQRYFLLRSDALMPAYAPLNGRPYQINQGMVWDCTLTALNQYGTVLAEIKT
ncbi:MAG: hypothetical protein IKU81_00565 [Oscillibacter sp.]|nr:hypothetical protein [Oscillibacter sp.]